MGPKGLASTQGMQVGDKRTGIKSAHRREGEVDAGSRGGSPRAFSKKLPQTVKCSTEVSSTGEGWYETRAQPIDITLKDAAPII